MEEFKSIKLVRPCDWIKIKILKPLKINIIQIAVLKTNDDCIIRLTKYIHLLHNSIELRKFYHCGHET